MSLFQLHTSTQPKRISGWLSKKRNERKALVDTNKENESNGSNLYLQAIISIVIILVVLAVGSAMMSSILKILENHAQNKISHDSADKIVLHSENFKYPKDLSYSSFSIGSQLKFKKQQTKNDLTSSSTASYS